MHLLASIWCPACVPWATFHTFIRSSLSTLFSSVPHSLSSANPDLGSSISWPLTCWEGSGRSLVKASRRRVSKGDWMRQPERSSLEMEMESWMMERRRSLRATDDSRGLADRSKFFQCLELGWSLICRRKRDKGDVISDRLLYTSRHAQSNIHVQHNGLVLQSIIISLSWNGHCWTYNISPKIGCLQD